MVEHTANTKDIGAFEQRASQTILVNQSAVEVLWSLEGLSIKYN